MAKPILNFHFDYFNPSLSDLVTYNVLENDSSDFVFSLEIDNNLGHAFAKKVQRTKNIAH